MTRIQENAKLETVAREYHSSDLAGINELYHVCLRDLMIPTQGGRSALELGCGKGLWTEVLCKRYERLTVVDGSRDLIENLEKIDTGSCQLSTCVALVEDFLANKTQPTWQHVYMTFLLEHLQDPVGVLRRIRRVLDPDGMLILAVPNAASLHRVLAMRAGLIQATDELSANDIRVGHRRVYSMKLLEQHVTCGGFRITSRQEVGCKPFALSQMNGLPDKVAKSLCASGDLVPGHAAYLGVTAIVDEAMTPDIHSRKNPE